METEKWTHIDDEGNAVMVDVSEKKVTGRTAEACGTITVNREILAGITDRTNPKGDVLAAARIAGIMAAKRTSDLIPLCHPLPITHAAVELTVDEVRCAIEARCRVRIDGKTGVEMEALTGVSVALLTVYDMCKALGKNMVISDVHLLTKTGGKSGDFVFKREDEQ